MIHPYRQGDRDIDLESGIAIDKTAEGSLVYFPVGLVMAVPDEVKDVFPQLVNDFSFNEDSNPLFLGDIRYVLTQRYSMGEESVADAGVKLRELFMDTCHRQFSHNTTQDRNPDYVNEFIRQQIVVGSYFMGDKVCAFQNEDTGYLGRFAVQKGGGSLVFRMEHMIPIDTEKALGHDAISEVIDYDQEVHFSEYSKKAFPMFRFSSHGPTSCNTDLIGDLLLQTNDSIDESVRKAQLLTKAFNRHSRSIEDRFGIVYRMYD